MIFSILWNAKKQINIQTKACQHIISSILQKGKRPSRTFKYRERKKHLGTAEPTHRFFINMDLGIKIGWWRRDFKEAVHWRDPHQYGGRQQRQWILVTRRGGWFYPLHFNTSKIKEVLANHKLGFWKFMKKSSVFGIGMGNIF